MARSLMGGGCLLAVLALLSTAFWAGAFAALDPRDVQAGQVLFARNCSPCHGESGRGDGADRKSTRLNSSHITISYAVFCLKKKKKKNIITMTLLKLYATDLNRV